MALRGHLDEADFRRLRGWAFDDEAPGNPVDLVVSVDQAPIGHVCANGFRQDLRDAGISDGRCAFDLDLEGLISPFGDHRFSVCSSRDGAHLVGSPVLVAGSERFEDVKAVFARIATTVETDADLDARLGFLAAQTDMLLGIADFRRAGHAEREARRRRLWLRPDLADEPVTRPKAALVIDARAPQSDRDGGSLAILAHMQSLQRLGYVVAFAPMDLGPGSPDLTRLGIALLSRPWYATVEEVLARNAGNFALVYLHRADVAALYGALVSKHQPRARIVYSVADLGSLRLERQAAALDHPDFLSVSRNEAGKEAVACHFADAVITHSGAEAAILEQRHRGKRVQVVPFAVPARPVERPFATRRGFAFVGNFDHQPNLDAALLLLDEVMPALALLDPTIPCYIAGSGMPPHLRTKGGGNVHMLGFVPELAVVYDMVRLTCAPLSFGAGVKGKVLESLASGLPCVCTGIAAEGLDLPAELRALIADEPGSLAALVHRVHEDEGFNTHLALTGIGFVADYASNAAIDGAMRGAVENRR